MKLITKLFIAGDWRVCLVKDNEIKDIKPAKGFWYADPFLFSENGKKYIFVEAFNKRKEIGYIGYLKEEDNFSQLNIILKGDCHYSFPNVFKVGKDFFLIPESSEEQGIFLYKFTGFPDKFQKVCNLKHGEYVDTALVSVENNIAYLVTYSTKQKELYSLVVNNGTKEVEFALLEKDVHKQLRPAGNAFIENGQLVMPFQNCMNKYGESIVLREIRVVDGSLVLCKIKKEITCKDLHLDKKAKRIHTHNVGKDGEIIVDYMIEKFSFLKSFKMLRRILRRKRHKREIENGK